MCLTMALRVLLADESSTIRKAIQMVLSDYGIEIKSVPSGLDVQSVAESFQPELVLADVLLSKKNGYEVCGELKSNPTTMHIPVILIWSSFMQLDQEQYKSCKADAALEKPFDTIGLRSLVEKHVPRLNTFPLKGFTKHASLPDFEESDTFIRQKSDFNNFKIQQLHKTESASDPTPATSMDDLNISFDASPEVTEEPALSFDLPESSSSGDLADSFQIQSTDEAFSFGDAEPISISNNEQEFSFDLPSEPEPVVTAPEITPEPEELIEIPLPPPKKAPVVEQSKAPVQAPAVAPPEPTPVKAKPSVAPTTPVVTVTEDPPEPQVNADSEKSWGGAKTHQYIIETESYGEFEEVKVISSRSEETPDLQKRINEQIQSYLKDSPVASHKAQNSLQSKSSYSSFDEQMMKEEVRQIAERICWQVIPEVTEKIVREELSKLLQGIETNS